MRTLSLALRNLLRNRRRSLATLLALAIGAAAILLFGGYNTNIVQTLQTAYVQSGGHLQIQHRDFYQYGSGNPLAYGIDGYARIIQAIQADSALRDEVLVATPVLQFGGIAGNYSAGVSRTVLAFGVVATDRGRMQLWNEFGLNLPPPDPTLVGESADSAIIGAALGRVLRLCEALKINDCPPSEKEKRSEGPAIPDDIAALSSQEAPSQTAPSSNAPKIELLASTARGAPNVASLFVRRAQPQAFKELDEVFVMLNLKQAQQLVFGTASPKATAIILQLKSGSEIPKVRQRLEALLSSNGSGQPLVVLDYRYLNPFYVQSEQLFSTIFGFIYCLIGSIVLFTVSNTMNMAVVERTVEIGTLRSIGLRRSGIRRLFIAEGLMLGLAGAVVGVLVATVLGEVVNHAGLTWYPPGSAHPIPLTLAVWSEPGKLVLATLGLIAIATGSALWPAHRAARMNVVEALRHT